MQALRNTRSLARFALLWFVLALGVAIASPVIKPQSVQLVCTGSGAVEVLRLTDEGTLQTGAHLIDCVLCIVAGAPPPATSAAVWSANQQSQLVSPVRAARVDAQCAPPLPARGPPASS